MRGGSAPLVVAAVPEELGDLPGELVGVGPIVAGARAAAILARAQPASVVLIGTAGAYPGGPPIGAAIAAAVVGWVDGVGALGLGYVPRPPAPIDADPALLAAVPLPRHRVATTGAISTDAALIRALAASPPGWDVEHLEAYAVASACRDAGIPFLAVLGIANDVGPDAHAQWLAHRDRAQDATRRAIAPLLGR